MDATAPGTVQWRAVGLFVVVAMGAAFVLDAAGQQLPMMIQRFEL